VIIIQITGFLRGGFAIDALFFQTKRKYIDFFFFIDKIILGSATLLGLQNLLIDAGRSLWIAPIFF